jgi:putative membrane protein
VAASTAVVERVGTRTGLPFGRYEYSGALRPRIAGVPAIVPLAWFAMAPPAREAAHAALGGRSTAVARVFLGACALTAWDLFLDPQMVGEGYWGWVRNGVYRGIPVSNFIGWFVTSVGVMLILERTLPVGAPVVASRSDPAVTTGAGSALVGEYAFVATMETVGFAKYFRDPVVAVVGGAAMLPIAAAAAVSCLRR